MMYTYANWYVVINNQVIKYSASAFMEDQEGGFRTVKIQVKFNLYSII